MKSKGLHSGQGSDPQLLQAGQGGCPMHPSGRGEHSCVGHPSISLEFVAEKSPGANESSWKAAK